MRWAILVAALGLAARPAARAATVAEVHYVMGAYFRITAEDVDPGHARRAMRACFINTRRLDEQFSRFDPASELARLNASAAAPGAVTVSAEMAALLRRAIDLQAQTRGTFDVSVGALTQLWRTAAQWPTADLLAATRQSDGARALVLNGTTLSRRPGVLIDVDGLAKGWAVDECVAQLRTSGVHRALLNFGESSLYALGTPRGAPGWRVAVRGLDDDHVVGMLTLRDEAVSVSSVFGHARDLGGERVGHIVDPRTGQALTSPALGVIVASSATDAEAFSKALLIDPALFRDGRPLASVIGSLRVTAAGMRRTGSVPFVPFAAPRRIAAEAEALR